MCWQALPMILTAAGTAAQYSSNNQLAQQREQEAAQGIIRQAQLSREADQRVSQATQEVASSNADAEQAAKRATYMDALRKSLDTRAGAVPTTGNVSSRFAEDANSAKVQTEAEAAQNADLTAAIEAPMYQRMNEGVAMNNANVDLSLLKGRSAGQDYLTRLRTMLAKGNGWLGAAGGLAAGAGGAMAGNVGFDDGTIDAFGVPAGSAKQYGSVRRARIPVNNMAGVNG